MQYTYNEDRQQGFSIWSQTTRRCTMTTNHNAPYKDHKQGQQTTGTCTAERPKKVHDTKIFTNHSVVYSDHKQQATPQCLIWETSILSLSISSLNESFTSGVTVLTTKPQGITQASDGEGSSWHLTFSLILPQISRLSCSPLLCQSRYQRPHPGAYSLWWPFCVAV